MSSFVTIGSLTLRGGRRITSLSTGSTPKLKTTRVELSYFFERKTLLPTFENTPHEEEKLRQVLSWDKFPFIIIAWFVTR